MPVTSTDWENSNFESVIHISTLGVLSNVLLMLKITKEVFVPK